MNDLFERNRRADWYDHLDGNGRPTCGPARADARGCDQCGGEVEPTHDSGIYACAWCIAAYGTRTVHIHDGDRLLAMLSPIGKPDWFTKLRDDLVREAIARGLQVSLKVDTR